MEWVFGGWFGKFPRCTSRLFCAGLILLNFHYNLSKCLVRKEHNFLPFSLLVWGLHAIIVIFFFIFCSFLLYLCAFNFFLCDKLLMETMIIKVKYGGILYFSCAICASAKRGKMPARLDNKGRKKFNPVTKRGHGNRVDRHHLTAARIMSSLLNLFFFS